MGYEVVLVSSGAIAVGRNKLNMTSKPDSMRMKQAAAAVGFFSMRKISNRKKKRKILSILSMHF